MAGNVKRAKPKVRTTTLKTLVDRASRSERPESEDRYYEFGNGTKSKKSGKGAYTDN